MDYSHKNLQGENFSHADLSGVNFSHANIQGANFNNAKLIGANFSHAKAGVQFIWGIALVIASLFLTTSINSIVAQFVAFGLDYSIGKAAIFLVLIISLISLIVFIAITNRRSLLSGFFTAIATTVIATVTLIIAAVIVPNFSPLISSGDRNFALIGLLFSPSVITISTIALALLLALGIVVAGNVTVYGGVFLAVIAIPDTAMSVVSNIVGRSINAQDNYEAFVRLVAEFDQKLISALNNPESQQLTPQDALQFATQILELAKPGIELAIAYGFFFVALPACILGVYIGWRTLAGDEQYEQIKNIAVISASLFGTRFREANLTDANFTQAELKSTDLSKANLTRTCWKAAKQLHQARFNNTYLEKSQIRKLVITGDGKNKDFDEQNLQGLNLENANLENASFVKADLTKANLRRANLAGAFLIETHLEEANLTKASLTDACIADWKITKNTQLDDIDCQYVYLKFTDGQKSSRLPNEERDFQPGEFTEVIRSLFDGFNLEHTEDIKNLSIEAVFLALQKISSKFRDSIAIIGIQKKNHTIVFKIKNNNPNNVEKIRSEYLSHYKQAAHFLQHNPKKFTKSQPESVQTAFNKFEQIIEKLKQLTTIGHYENFVIPENSIVFLGGNIEGNKMLGDRNTTIGDGNYNENIQRDYLETNNTSNIGTNTTIHSPNNVYIQGQDNTQVSQILSEKIQELKNTINLNSELIPTNIAYVLEQVDNLEQAAQNPKEQLSQRTSKKASRVIRGIISELPPSKLTQDYDKLLTDISNLFKSLNMTANESSSKLDESKQESPLVAIENFHNDRGNFATGKQLNMNIDQRKLKVGRDLKVTGANIMSDNAIISDTVVETINQLPSSTNPNQPRIKELLTQLKNAIADSPDLDNEDKEEAAEKLKAIAQSALDPQDEVKKKELRKAIKFFRRTVAILPASAALTTICDRVLPAISNWFGIGN